MTLQRVLTVATFIVASLALVSAGALVGITTLLHSSTVRLSATLQSVRAAEELQANLARSNRSSILFAMTNDPAYARERLDAEHAVLRSLDDARRHIEDAREAEALRNVEISLRDYDDARARQEALGLPALESYRTIQPALDAATARIDQFVDENFRQAIAAQKRSARWDMYADIVGVAVAVLLVSVLVGLLLALRSLVVRPLVALRAAVRSVGKGDGAARASLVGVAEVREIATALNDANDALQRQREVQLQFLAGVAHDLRNPLAALSLSASAPRTDHSPDAEARLAHLRQLVVRQVDRLNRMVTDLLDATRIEAGHLDLRRESRDVRELVHGAVALFESTSPAHPIMVKLPGEPVCVDCDAARIEQVLNNLLSNAIKYSPAGGTIDVEVRAQPSRASISVRDRGIGIAVEDLPRIFEPFRRTAATRNTIPGVGLGLSVARRIVEAHGGHLDVASEPGRGATFTIVLDREPWCDSRPPSPPTREAPAQPT